MATLTVRRLTVNNFQIIDVSTSPEQMPATVIRGHNYHLRICIRNTNANDAYWYDNVQLRVVPMSPAVQFFSDGSYSTPVFRFSSPLFTLGSSDLRWFTIPFRWTGNQPANIATLKFNTGIYCHELPINHDWKKLTAPI